ncbi:g495 [Coccomyxa viridis]|uniref:G495 protein n=1 Tax=Coccomyxa viridis TaxID=1274662 RepID=A0ABP1FG19_9CHLO
MVRGSASLSAQIGRLATPQAELLGGPFEKKVQDFFREVSRLLPWTIKNYKLDEIVTLGELRRNVSLLFRQHANVTDPKVVDILIYKGREELESVALQHKQRHHLIGQFIVAPQKLREQMARKRPISEFLENFYTNRLP